MPIYVKSVVNLNTVNPLLRPPGKGGTYISNRFERVLIETGGLFERGSFSSSLRPGTKGFT